MNTALHHDHRDLAERTATPRPYASGPASTDGRLVAACRAGDQTA